MAVIIELSILRLVCESSLPLTGELMVTVGVSATALTVTLKFWVIAWLSSAPVSFDVTLVVIVAVPE